MSNGFTITADGPRGYTWVEWFEIVEFIKEVDYGCQFDGNGCCQEFSHRDPMNCCSGCNGTFGYWAVIPPEAVEEVEAIFDDKTGFWRPGGCILPTEYKSAVCLNFQCDQEAYRGNANDIAWRAFISLVNGPEGPHVGSGDTIPTIDEVRELMRGIGCLRESALVQLT
jgi:hypothetical protein